jgi:hypothetical protein
LTPSAAGPYDLTVMPRWDKPHERVAPFGEKISFEEAPGGRPAEPLGVDFGLWLYIAKGIGIMLVGAIVLTNAMYGFFELLNLLAGN